MTLDEARSLIAQTQSPAQRIAAEQLLNEALALPHLPAEQRDAAITRIRQLESTVPDYHLSSFGASVLESIGDSLADPAGKKVAYAEALYLAEWYASCATSGGEGTARSRHVHEIEAKLRGLEPASGAARYDAIERPDGAAALDQLPPSGVVPAPTQDPRSRAFLRIVGWIFILAGALGTPVSLLSLLMISAGAHGSAGGSFFDGLIVIGGPPVTLIAGIGLLRRWQWAYGYTVALLIVFATYNVVQVLRGSTPEQSTVSPDGVINTVLASSVNYPLHLTIIAICAGVLMKLLKPEVRAEFARPPRA